MRRFQFSFGGIKLLETARSRNESAMRGERQDQHWCVYENHGGEWGKCGRIPAEDIRGKYYVWQGGHYMWKGGHYI